MKIEKSTIENPEQELFRLDEALNLVIKETDETVKKLERADNKEQAQIMQAYLMVLQDS